MIHQIDVNDDADEDSFNIDIIEDSFDHPDTIYANIDVSTGDTLRFKIDSGAQTNVIPLRYYEQLSRKPDIVKDSTRLCGYGGQKIRVIGCIHLSCYYKNSSYSGAFYIARTEGNSQPVLGLRGSLQLNIIKIVLSVTTPMLTEELI